MSQETVTRAAYRGQVTRLANSVVEYLSSPESRNTENADDIEEELESYLQRLTAAHDSLCAVNNEIHEKALIKAEDYERESLKIVEYEETAINAISRIKVRLNKIRAKSRAANNGGPSPMPPSEKQGCTKLERLKLKKFFGNQEEWIPFWQQFRTAVHENSTLSGVEKFHYLQSVLSGEAARAIEGFIPSDECYDSAIGLLQEEYGETEKLIDLSMQQLMELPRVSSRNDVVGLRHLYNTVVSTTRSLTTLQVPTTHYSIMLKTILLSAIPSDMRLEYHRCEKILQLKQSKDSNSEQVDINDSVSVCSSSVSCGDMQVKSVLTFLKREVESLERASISKCSKPALDHKTKRAPTTAAGLLTTNKDPQCVFCRSNTHLTRDCDRDIKLEAKKKILQQEGRCFRCTHKGHTSKFCRMKELRCNNCCGRHVTVMCDPVFNRKFSKSGTSLKVAVVDSEEKSANLSAYTESDSRYDVFLKTARVFAFSPRSSVKLFVRIVIDGASQRTYIRKQVAEKLKLPVVGVVKLNILPFGSAQVNGFEEYDLVSLILKGKDGKGEVLLEAVAVPEICADVLPIPNQRAAALYKLDLADLDDRNYEQEPGLSILIGADYYWRVLTGEVRRLTPALSAVQTLFGWTLHGPGPVSIVSATTNTTKSSQVLASLAIEERDFSEFWKLESIGIKADELEKSNLTSELQRACIIKRGSRYEAALPWNSNAHIENNKNNAQHRLRSLIRKLSKCPEDLIEYDRAMYDLLRSGVAERVTNEDEGERHYYMPHRPVYRLDKPTTRIRIVFDASSHAPSALSLNDHLHTGANLLPDVLKMLLNFRLGNIALIGDIEKAFLQLSLKREDRDSHRFLWFSNPVNDITNLPAVSTFRMTRVTFGVTSSPFLLSATILKHLEIEENDYPETRSILKDSFYMDDLIVTTNDKESAKRIYTEANELMRRASMQLRKWNSNSSEVRKMFAEDDIPSEQKVLGIKWNTCTDEIAPCLDSLVNFLANHREGSKRNVLQCISRIYDPLGLLGPVVIGLKVIFQEIWKAKLDWDASLNGELNKNWRSCLNEILAVREFYVPRNVCVTSRIRSQELHVFADASQKAYGAVAYVRIKDQSGNFSARILCSKSRVAPLKESGCTELTLPRLELTAALIAARLVSYLKKSLKLSFDRIFLWSDSQITLHWIRGDSKKWKPYVTARVNEIRCLTDANDWRHTPGKDNPADLVTRGATAASLLSEGIWLNGPSWLNQDISSWPNNEIKAVQMPQKLASLLVPNECITNAERPPLLPYQDFSCWKRLLRVTGYVIRFCRFKKENPPAHPIVQAEELIAAENYWIRYIQHNNFSNEFLAIRVGKNIPNSSKLWSLCPWVDTDGLLRVGGRLQALQENIDVVHPIILPDCYLSRLIIKDAHKTMLHGGVNLTLSRVRDKFWIIKGRQLIKRIIKSCIICRKTNSKPMTQPFAPLPKDRLQLVRPFSTVGIDFAGPLHIKGAKDPELSQKVYIMIFTCAVLRCIHLELVRNLTAESCLLAIRRFVARRGIPDAIYSDNAKTFKKASKELPALTAVLRNESIANFVAGHQIKWKFIVERAPWWGGFWERLIKSVKSILKVTIAKATLNLEQLQTLLDEAENIVNERPLTYIGNDPTDPKPLTPNLFLRGTTNPENANNSESDTTSATLREAWLAKCRTVRYLAKRWRSEYLQLLRSFHNSTKMFTTKLHPGDVVLLHDPSIPRIHWKMAVITKTFPGRDNRVRSCELRIGNGTVMKRPIQLLYPLEMQNFAAPEDVENYND